MDPLSPASYPCHCQVLDKFTSLPHIFTSFRQCLVDSDGMLKKHKEKFRTGLLQDAEDFKRTVNDLVEAFESGGPFTSETTLEQVRRFTSRQSCRHTLLCLSLPLPFLAPLSPSQSPLPLHLSFTSLCPSLLPSPPPSPPSSPSLCPPSRMC